MIYLDNAATTYHKPKSVVRAASKFYGNAGRGGHKIANLAGEIVFECREELAKLFTVLDSSRIVFTKNATEAINTAILGIIKPNDHVIISAYEHNSVARCVKGSGAEFDIAWDNNFEKLIKPNTKMVCVSHVCNVNGFEQDIRSLGKMCRNRGILFMVDAAQSAGVYNIDCLDCHIDLLAFPGHKSLYGLSGTGGLYVREGIEIKPLIFGGTGSLSEELNQPNFMPDKLESGSLNVAGIASLLKGVKFAREHDLYGHSKELAARLIEGLRNRQGIELYSENPVNVVAFNIKGKDSIKVANELSMRYNIAVRGGYHCAALAHKKIGTLEIGGAVRASFGYFNKKSDVDKLLAAVGKII